MSTGAKELWDALGIIVERATEEKTDKLQEFLFDIRDRMEKIERLLAEPSRSVDHQAIAVVPGEGLKGGGTIEKSVDLGLDFHHLHHLEYVRPVDNFVAVYNEESKQHCVIPMPLFVEAISLSGPLMPAINELTERLKKVEAEVRTLRQYQSSPPKIARVV